MSMPSTQNCSGQLFRLDSECTAATLDIIVTELADSCASKRARLQLKPKVTTIEEGEFRPT